MKLIMSSIDNKFRPITFYGYNTYREEHDFEFPITKTRRKRHAEAKLLLSSAIDLFKYPERENKEVDLVFTDGVLHNNAIYKPTPFTLNLFHSEIDFMNLVGDLYLTRGTFKCKLYTDWGTINTFYPRALEYDEFKKTLTFDNPSVIVSTIQESVHYFISNSNVLRLYPDNVLYPSVQQGLYPHFVGEPSPIEEQYVYVANPENCIMNFNFNLGLANTKVDSITINNTRWKLGTLTIPNNETIKIDYSNNTIKMGNTLLGDISKVGKCYTTNSIKIELNKSTSEQGYSGQITLTITSSGNYNVIS